MSAIRAGFAEVGITPVASRMVMDGLVDQSATEVVWPPHGRVALFDDGARRAAVVVLDVVAISSETTAELRAAMAQQGGLAAGEILISCTHAHNCAKMFDLYGESGDQTYLELLAERLPQAMAAAAAALEPVELEAARVATEGLTFNRRPIYADGEVASGGPRWVEEFTGVEGPTDEELQLLVARRADGSLAGGIVGFACHPHAMLPEPVWSADFPGGLTEELARRHGGTFLFLQGAAGDLHWVDQRTPTPWTNWWVDPDKLLPEARAHARANAERQAEGLIAASEAALAALGPIGAGPVRAASRTLELRERVPTAEQLELARWFLAQDPASVDLDDLNRRMTGHASTFYENGVPIQDMFARDILLLADNQARLPQPPTGHVEVQAIAIGDVGFVAYPGEMFNAFGLRTKRESPLAMTFPCGVSNGWFGYIPTLEAFDRGGYEPRLDASTRLVPEAGDRMVDTAIELLGELVRPA